MLLPLLLWGWTLVGRGAALPVGMTFGSPLRRITFMRCLTYLFGSPGVISLVPLPHYYLIILRYTAMHYYFLLPSLFPPHTGTPTILLRLSIIPYYHTLLPCVLLTLYLAYEWCDYSYHAATCLSPNTPVVGSPPFLLPSFPVALPYSVLTFCCCSFLLVACIQWDCCCFISSSFDY